jgi:hypothetical protein
VELTKDLMHLRKISRNTGENSDENAKIEAVIIKAYNDVQEASIEFSRITPCFTAPHITNEHDA